MKSNCIVIPLEKTSKYNKSSNPKTPNPTTNKALRGHLSFNSNSNFYQQKDYYEYNIITSKNSNNNLVLKRNDLHPTISNRNNKNQYFEMKSYSKEKYPESEMSQQRINSSNYKTNDNNGKFFNGQSDKLTIKKNIDNKENIDKNRPNYSYYESKYTKKTNVEKDNYSNKAKTNDIINKNIYQNENLDTSHISSTNNIKKFKRIDSNFSIKYEPENSGSKKGQDMNCIKTQKDRIKSLVNSNDKNSPGNRTILINNNKNNDNKYNYQNPPSTHFDTLKNIYHSPVKRIRIDKYFYGSSDNTNNKYVPNTNNKNIEKHKENNNTLINKKMEIIKLDKSKIAEKKKSLNYALKKIPFSPKDKKSNNSLLNKMENQKKYLKLELTNIKENNNKIKNNYSFTASKPQGNNTKIQSRYNENSEKNNSLIQKMKLTDSKTFKKKESADIGEAFNFKKFVIENGFNSPNKSKINTVKISSRPLNPLNEENKKNKIISISYNYNNNSNIVSSREEINQKKNLVLNKIKKDKSGIIGNNTEKIPNNFIRRFNSQRQFIFLNNEIKDEKSNNESNKIKSIRNNLVNSGTIDHNQRYTNEISLNKNNNYESNSIKIHSNSNILNTKSNIFSRSQNYNDNTEIKLDKRKNCNSIHTITISKINPTFLEKNHRSSKNLKTNTLKNIPKSPEIQKIRYLTNFPKYEASYQISGENDEDIWEDNEYKGLKKKTYDPRRRKTKNMHKGDTNDLIKNTFVPSEIFSQAIFIKACESLTVPGKNENGKKKINQDSYIIERNINGILNFNIFGVLDGHGEDGHYASQFVSRYITTHLKNHPLLKKCEDIKEIYEKLIFNGYEIISNLFVEADIQIQKEKFDFKNSGTTCVLVLQLEEKIICANAGDSRAIMIYDKNKDDNLLESKIYNLSYDCKPELPNERKRIYELGGSVEKALDENDQPAGPYRVYAKGEEYPGLAMSRSIGDIDAKKIGVIPNPQIVEYNIDYDSKYMIICSDGIWEFISNNDAMIMGNKYYLRNDAAGLCQELYKKSIELWLKEDVVVDDITAIAVFF